MTTEEKKDQQVAQKPAESEKVLLRNGNYVILFLYFRLKKLKKLKLHPSPNQKLRKKKRARKPNLIPKSLADKEATNGARKADELIKLKMEILVRVLQTVNLANQVVLIRVATAVVVFGQEKTLGVVET